jgi:hypothetical protein
VSAQQASDLGDVLQPEPRDPPATRAKPF